LIRTDIPEDIRGLGGFDFFKGVENRMDIKDISGVYSREIELRNLELGCELTGKGVNIVNQGKVVVDRKKELLERIIFEIWWRFEFIGNNGKDEVELREKGRIVGVRVVRKGPEMVEKSDRDG